MKLFNNIKVDKKTVWSVIALGASVLGLIAGQQNDAIKENDLTEKAAEKAAELVKEQLSKQS